MTTTNAQPKILDLPIGLDGEELFDRVVDPLALTRGGPADLPARPNPAPPNPARPNPAPPNSTVPQAAVPKPTIPEQA